MHPSRGITLLELMLALTVLGVLAALAVPAWSAARAAVASFTLRAELQDALQSGMRLAFLQRANVVLCSSRDQARCSGSTMWEEGWIAFVDRDRDRQPDADGALVRAKAAFGADLRLRSSAGRTRIVLQPDGGAANGSNASFTLCDRRGAAHARRIVLAASGNLRTVRVAEGTPVVCP